MEILDQRWKSKFNQNQIKSNVESPDKIKTINRIERVTLATVIDLFLFFKLP